MSNALYRAVAADPRNYRALSCRAVLRLQTGRPAGAQRDAEQALSINPRYLSAEANLAHALYRLGDRGGAISHYSQPWIEECRKKLGR